MPTQPPRLQAQFISTIRTLHYSRRTQEAYWHWIRAFKGTRSEESQSLRSSFVAPAGAAPDKGEPDETPDCDRAGGIPRRLRRRRS